MSQIVIDWRNYCRALDGISVSGEVVEVVTHNERRQRISVHETADTFELTGVVARAAAIRDIQDVPLRIWRHNRATQLVGFRIDERGRIVGETWVPKAGLSRTEFLFYIKHLAVECDLFEYQLTGKDRE